MAAMLELLRMAHLIMIALASGLTLAQYIALRASVGREREAGLALTRRTLADITSFAVGFVWISGLTLLWSRFSIREEELSAWFYAKLGFVILFTLAHIMQRVSARHLRHGADSAPDARRAAERWVSVAWLATLLAICFGVISFA